MLKFSTNDSDYLPILESLIGLPWWATGPESICQCKGHGFDPCSGKISHSMGQLGLCTTTAEQKSESGLHSPPTRESSCAATKTQHGQE